jgi:glutaredoxin
MTAASRPDCGTAVACRASRTRQVACVLLLLMATTVGAQQPLYRIVGPDGRVTYTDRPPAAQTPSRPASGPTPGSLTAGLPSDLAAIVGRFPVQLYTGPSCSGCEQARALLVRRGVPFQERTVSNARDTAELERLTGDRVLPSLRIGRQVVAGFSTAEWSGWLDAAGYPAVSRLPAGWRPAEPRPLTVAPEAARVPAEPAPVAPPVSQPGPGGIRF